MKATVRSKIRRRQTGHGTRWYVSTIDAGGTETAGSGRSLFAMPGNHGRRDWRRMPPRSPKPLSAIGPGEPSPQLQAANDARDEFLRRNTPVEPFWRRVLR